MAKQNNYRNNYNKNRNYNGRKKNTQQKQKSKYVTAYSKSDYDKDEKQFNDSIENGKPIDWSNFKRLFLHDLCIHTNIIDTSSLGRHKLDDVKIALEFPQRGYRILMDVSDYLMRISPHYLRLNNYFSNMALFCWGIDLYDIKDNAKKETIKKIYSTLATKLEGMNLKHEFSKIMKVLPYQDVYCGLAVEDETDFYIQQVNFNICRIYETQDGIYNFAIDLSRIKPKNLGAYPNYVQETYIDYVDNRIGGNWYIPPADRQICIKFNQNLVYPFPFLIGLVRDILDLDIYKKLKLQSARTDNYKAIMIKVPIDENTIDKPLLTPETLSVFAEMNRESLSDDIGIIHTLGSNGEAVSFKDSNNTRNNVADSTDDIYNSGGITKELFNGSSSGTAVTYSIENDSGYIYAVYRQFERWVNRFIKLRKYNKQSFKFYFYLLDITIFNRDNVSKRYKEAISLGVTVIDKWLASLDMTPSRVLGSFVTHKDIFDFQNNFVPLSSTYNSSANTNANNDNGQGRRTNDEKGELLTESGEQTKDNDSNSKR